MKNKDDSHILEIKKKNGLEDDPEVSKRPWRNNAEEVSLLMPDGTERKCWVLSVVDANGDRVCFGKSADMNFIVEMENTYDSIIKMLESHKKSCDDEIEKIKEFRRIPRTKTIC